VLPAFSRDHPGHAVRLVAVGSGQALALGRRGDADLLLAHSAVDEERFMADGAGRRRVPLLRNDFVLVGPPADPAGASEAPDAAAALRAIAAAGARFISRGDSSGTHRAELRLWQDAGVDAATRAALVSDVGQGMAETLSVATERQAYALTDRATFVALSAGLDLRVVHQGDARLANVYSVITVRGARNEAGADLLADWLASPAAAAVIRGFGTDEAGRPLFVPLSGAR
jgi:tungstate transport system substrate-binding protein